MNFIKKYPQYYIPIIVAPFFLYKYKYDYERYKKYQEFDFREIYKNCYWCNKKLGESGRCNDCFIRMFNDPR